jgi:hypothetical protein
MIRIYTIYKEDEELARVDSIADCLDTIHTTLSEMPSGDDEELQLSIKVRSGSEDEV